MKKRLRIKRRIYFCLFLFVVGAAIMLLTKWKKSGSSISENSVSSDTAVSSNHTVSSEEVAQIPGSQLPVSQAYNTTVSGSSLLDVTRGTAVVDLSAVSENRLEMTVRAKQAMAGVAYFSGSNLTVNEILSAYGAGEWHAILNKQDDLCVFYKGERDGVSFRINFELFDDGTFILVSASRNGENIEDFEGFVSSIAGR